MTLTNYIHWTALIGAFVEIRHHGRVIRTGTVDDATEDSSVLWIAAEGVQPQTMYQAALVPSMGQTSRANRHQLLPIPDDSG